MSKKSLTSLSNVLMVIAFAIALLFGWSKTGWKALAVPTGSMQPSISTNSLAFIHQVDTDTLQIGDVITYMSPLHQGETVTHRITKVSILEGGIRSFTTKGDANQTTDIPIASGSVVGKVVGHVPHLGSLMLGTKTWVGIAILVYLPAVLLIIEEVRRLADYLRLSIPYKLYGYGQELRRRKSNAKYGVASSLAGVMLVGGLAYGVPAYALLMSNTVSLSPNILSVAGPTTSPVTPPQPSNGTCSNTTNVNVTNTSTQTATSGNASTTGDTTGGGATSGNASNSNSSNINIGVTNGC